MSAPLPKQSLSASIPCHLGKTDDAGGGVRVAPAISSSAMSTAWTSSRAIADETLTLAFATVEGEDETWLALESGKSLKDGFEALGIL